MKNISAMLSGKWSNKALLIGSAFMLTVSTAPQSYAEDIEIYEDLTGDAATSVPEELKPNLLFLLDTSGSMAFGEATLNVRPDFDPSVTYGNSNNDDIYIYDNNRVYTDNFVRAAQNNCQAAKDAYALSPGFPEFPDQAVVWQNRPAVPAVPAVPEIPASFSEQCTTPAPIEGIATNVPRRVETFGIFGIIAGEQLDIRLTFGAQFRVRIEFFNSGGSINSGDLPSFVPCPGPTAIGQHNENNPFSCTINFPDNTDILGARVRYLRDENVGGNERFITQEITQTRCDTVQDSPGTPGVPGIPAVPGFADWVVSYDPADQNEIQALECQTDDGRHGPTTNSSEVYPQHQEPSNTSFQPNYVANAGNSNRLDWRSSVFPLRYLYPGNYHDYLQTPDATFLAGATVVDLPQIVSNGFNGFTSETVTDAVRYCILESGTFVREQNSNDIYFCEPRMAALKDAMDNILSGLTGVNVGIARFNLEEGGSIIDAVSDIDEGNRRQEVIATVRALPASGSTPLQESLNEARRYYHSLDLRESIKDAEKRVPRDSRTTLDVPPTNRVFTDITDPDAVDSNGNYISPIISECQDNNIILLSDGAATRDVGDIPEIRTFSGQTCGVVGSTRASDQGACLAALANGLATNDANLNVPETNIVNLYTVAFGSDVAGSTALPAASNQALRPGAALDSQHFEASNADDLTTTFQSILRDLVRVEADTFVAPAVSVSAFNRLQFNDEVYFAVFEPNDSPRWNGNIKGYRIDSSANILNDDGSPAVDETTGTFLDSARSFWSDQNDGAEVTLGGFTEQLDLNPVRQLYANIIDTDVPGGGNNPVIQLTEADFLTTIDGTNNSVASIGELGFNGDAALVQQNRDDIVAWTFGQDVDGDLGGAATDPNFFIGESLHSSPYVLDFGSVNTTDPNIDFDSKNIIFSLTNQGMVHAIDAEDGNELWAYIPDASLFSNLGDYYNDVFGVEHTYGLDGEIAFDVTRDPTSLELTRANIFVGQRRGGSKYFAMNLFNADFSDAPAGPPVSKLWTLSDLPRMGQSWATPVVTKINFCDDGDDKNSCTETEVLVISGGYDEAYDNENVAVEDLAGNVAGNAIYIVDRATGELLWVAGRPGEVESGTDYAYYTNDEMTHSFPTEPTVIDADNDGVADLMFAVDIAGRVWRFDFRGHAIVGPFNNLVFDTNDIVRNANNNAIGSEEEVSGGIIADLSEPGVDRRFYNRLDISRSERTEDDLARFNIVVGSGYRAHPRFSEPAVNRIYFVFDRNTTTPQATRDSNGDFTGITYNYVETGTGFDNNINIDELNDLNGNPLDTVSANRHGFFIPLPNADEKLINPTLTNAGTVLAVSFAPSEDVLSGEILCQRTTGVSFLHRIDLNDGSFTTIDLDADGISARPVVIEVPDDTGRPVKILVVGIETFETGPDDSDGDGEPNVELDPSKSGEIRRLNWWERNRTLVQ